MIRAGLEEKGVTDNFNLQTGERKSGIRKKQSVEEIMHNTGEKRGYQTISVQFRIYDAKNLRYVSIPDTALTVNVNGPVEVEKTVKGIREWLKQRAREKKK